MSKKMLTIGMATFDDFYGVHATVQSLRTSHPDLMREIELIVVDSNPESEHGKEVKSFLGWIKPSRYIAMPRPGGTTQPRQRVFEESQSEWTLCIDCHVMLEHGTLPRLLEWINCNCHSQDIVSGPILWPSLEVMATHFDPKWQAQMWGIWGTDERGKNPDGEPFETWAMGLGLFVMRTAAWPGFSKRFRGFGGEEGYIHEKVRRAGGKSLCLPFLRWDHRFARPGGVKYPNHPYSTARNYVIGHRELGLDIEPIRRHFVDETKTLGPAAWAEVLKEHEWPVTAAQVPPSMLDAVEWYDAHPTVKRPGFVPEKGPCGCGEGEKLPGSTTTSPLTVEDYYREAVSVPGELKEFVPLLKDLAGQSKVVVEFPGCCATSTIAFLAAQPETLIVCPPDPSPPTDQLMKVHGKTLMVEHVGPPEFAPVNYSDLFFVDGICKRQKLLDLLERHAPKSRGRIAIHDVVKFKEADSTLRAPGDGKREGPPVYEDGSPAGPGLMPAIRQFLKDHPEWTVKAILPGSGGLMVLTRLEADKKEPPPDWKKGWNYLKASVRRATIGWGVASDETVENRISLCMVCPSRNGVVCGECGCPIEKKASWPTEQCPIGQWHPEDV